VKRKLILTILITTLLIALYIFAQGFFVTTEPDKTPVTETKPADVHNSPVRSEGQAPASSDPAGPAGPQKMELSPAEKRLTKTKQTVVEDFTYSLKKERKEKQITPGVSYESGKGINMKIPDQEETVQIRRDHTYREGEYRVLWEKKY
jgi:hypothetical protein